MEFVTSGYRSSYSGERADPPWVHRIFQLVRSRNGWSRAAMFLEGKDERKVVANLRTLVRDLPVRLQNIRVAHETIRLAPRNERAMEAWLKGREFDVAYLFGLHMIGASVTRPLTKRGIPLVYHQGDDWLAARIGTNRVKRALLTTAHPITYPRERGVDRSNVVLVSEFLRRQYLDAGFPPESTSVIYRGIEFPLAEDLNRPRLDPPTFLVASRLAFYKGVHVAIEAAAALHQEAPERDWRLWIAGSGEPETIAAFEALVDEAGVRERVSFLGKLTRDETVALMRKSTAFISPSIFGEPLGNTNLEALATGTPLIGSRTGAMEEIVEDGVSGLTYDKADPQALAACMTRLLDDPALGRRLTLAGLERVRERFTMSAVMDQVEAKLAEVSGSAARE